MTTDSPTAIRRDVYDLAMQVGVARSFAAASGHADPVLDDAADRLNDLILRAGRAERDPQPMVAATERLDPDQFGRRVRLRRRMDALRQKRAGR